MISDCWQALITDSSRHWAECPLAKMAILRGKRQKLAKTFFMQVWFYDGILWQKPTKCPLYGLWCYQLLGWDYSCLFSLKQIKNQTRILWYNFDFIDVIWHPSNFREVSYFYLCYFVMFWKMIFSEACIVLICVTYTIWSTLSALDINGKEENLCILLLFFYPQWF